MTLNLKIFYCLIVILVCSTPIDAQITKEDQIDMSANQDIQNSVNAQVENVKMLIEIQNMISYLGVPDEDAKLQASLQMDIPTMVRKFQELQELKKIQIEYLESKEEEINRLLLKFNEIERKSKALNP